MVPELWKALRTINGRGEMEIPACGWDKWRSIVETLVATGYADVGETRVVPPGRRPEVRRLVRVTEAGQLALLLRRLAVRHVVATAGAGWCPSNGLPESIGDGLLAEVSAATGLTLLPCTRDNRAQALALVGTIQDEATAEFADLAARLAEGVPVGE